MAKALNYSVPTSVSGQKIILAASSVAMIDYVRNQFTAQVLQGLHQRAETLGVEIVTRPVSGAKSDIENLRIALEDDSVAGFLFLSIDDENALALSRDFGKPVVLINSDDPLMRLSSVTPCNRSGARIGAEYLQSLGHERILFLMRRGRRTIERRFEGWRDALFAKGIRDVDDLTVEVADWLPELAVAAIERRIAETRPGLHSRSDRRRKPRGRRDDGRAKGGFLRARRRFRHRHGRPAAGCFLQPAALLHSCPHARDWRERARSSARCGQRQCDAGAPH